MWVYKANDKGYPGATGNTSFSSCTTNCIQYSWIPASKSFDTANPGGSGWPAASQNACDTVNWDSVGVYVRLIHKYLTKLFGATITLWGTFISTSNGCQVIGVSNQSSPGPSYNGQWVTFQVPIPDDYDCDDFIQTGCWTRLRFSYPAGTTVNDTTTWNAFMLGDPVRLIK